MKYKSAEPRNALFSTTFEKAFSSASNCHSQFEVVCEFFATEFVTAEEDIRPNTLYYLRGKDRDHLVVSDENLGLAESVPLRHATSGKSIKPLSRSDFLKLGDMQKLFRLIPREFSAPTTLDDSKSRDAVSSDGERSESDETILDMGAFNHLLDAAKRCGLVPDADVIAHVRDREFRTGDYSKSFQTIERLNSKFSAAATQRLQRLRREEIDIKSGKIKISPKELQAKRIRDTAESQRVDRARSKFARVMEGLRVLIKVNARDDEESKRATDESR